MKEHHHPGEEPERSAPPSEGDDLDTRLFSVSQAHLRAAGELDVDLDARSAPNAVGPDTDEDQGERFWFGVFAAYLDLGIALPEGRDPVTDCEQRYLGTWTDRGSFIRDQLEARGWDRALTDLQVEWGIWPGDMVWDEGVLWEHFAETYQFSKHGGSFHAFRR